MATLCLQLNDRSRACEALRRRCRRSFGILPWIALLLLCFGLAACGPDPEQARLCADVLDAVDPPLEDQREVRAARDPEDPQSVVLAYRDTAGQWGPATEPAERWLRCRFAGGAMDVDRLALVGVETDQGGPLSPVRLMMLRRWLGMFAGDVGERVRATRPAPADTVPRRLAYLAQQVVNGLGLGTIYALVAVGYTLVYAIIGRINLAFGEMLMIGGFSTFLGMAVLAVSGELGLAAALPSVLLLAVASGAVHGLVTERLVFKPLRGAGTLAPLVATIGLAVLLQEYVRLVQGSGNRWLQPLLTAPHVLGTGGELAVRVTTAQLFILALFAGLCAVLWVLLVRTSFGRCYRACADDVGMAALVGVDVDRTVALAFVVGTGFAAAGGYVVALHYGGVNFFMGHMIGFKALAAAVVGGIGSAPGAVLGGLLIGLVESLWSAYFPMCYREAAVFLLLAAVLIFRPEGLLGRSQRGQR